MAATDPPPQSIPPLADRLAAARRRRFVGREGELRLFRSALLAEESVFAVLHIYGPGGVGKTTLLREYDHLAAESGRPVWRLDGRNIDPTPPGFLYALHQAMGFEVNDSTTAPPAWPTNGILLIDTYETLAALDGWLRETFLPQLPGQTLVVLAGRNTPEPVWRADMGWGELTRIVRLDNLRPEESQTYLTTRGIPETHHAEVLAFTHGHPLALSLVADVVSQSEGASGFSPRNEPDVVRTLLERFVQAVPGPDHRLALEVCTLAWATTEALLAEVLSKAKAPALFEWLRGLSFIEQGPQGLFPHDLAREVLNADLRWRNRDSYRRINRLLVTHLTTRLLDSSSHEQQRLWIDLIYLARHNPFMRPYFDWQALDRAYSEPATVEDHPAIVAMVRHHEGDESAKIAQYWLNCQPQGFLIYRNIAGDRIGFMVHLTLHEATPQDQAADPAVRTVLDFVERHGPIQPGDEIVFLRFWMGQTIYQAPSSIINLSALNSTVYWTSHPKLAWNFIATGVPEFLEPHFTSIHIWRSPEADFEVGGHHYGVFGHDWRVEPVIDWLGIKAELTGVEGFKPMTSSFALATEAISQSEFAAAVRQALRDYTRPDLLTANPLMHTRLLGEAAQPTALQALLREAAEILQANPKDEKFYRALRFTYLEPAPTQELAAERLNLPFSTYRYHLTNGLERITAWLWQRQQADPNPS